MRHPFLAVLTGFTLLLILSQGKPVRAAERGSHQMGGSIRTIAGAVENTADQLVFGQDRTFYGISDTILRLTAEGRSATGTSYQAHLVQDVFFTTDTTGAGSTSFYENRARGRYRALDLSWTWAEEENSRATLFLDRLNAGRSSGKADVTIGRQAINFAQAWFWNPLDIFLPFNPEAFDRSYKPGVDAFLADFSSGPYTSFTLVAAAGNRLLIVPADGGGLQIKAQDFTEEPWYGSALMGRARTTWHHWDLTLQLGKVYGGYQAGAGFSGEAGRVGLRGEATWFDAAGESTALLPGAGEKSLVSTALVEDHASFVVGADHRFDGSLYLNAEYFFNGAGEEDNYLLSAARVATGGTTNLGKHYGGFLASYELHPLVTGQISWIHSFTDGSDSLSPVFSWSVSDETECLFGAILGFGDTPAAGVTGENAALLQGSEFGTTPDWYFLEFIYYF
jgi:hypothetical protein